MRHGRQSTPVGRWIAVVAVAALGFGATYVVAQRLLPGALAWAARYASVTLGQDVLAWISQLGPLGLALGVGGSLLRLGAWAVRRVADRRPGLSVEELQETHRALASRLLMVYGEQERRLGVSRSVPLTVRFCSTGRPAVIMRTTGRVLPRAAVIEIQPVAVRDAIEFLTQRRRPSAGSAALPITYI